MNKTILVVEDEDDLRKNIAKMLSIMGFKILEAVNGRKGLETALKENIDLIISDIKMPEMDGYDFLFELKKNTDKNNIPFIFLTSNIEREQMRNGMNLGADDYITKPFSIEELTMVIVSKFKKTENLDLFYNNKFSGIINELTDKVYKNPSTGLPNTEEFNKCIEKIKNDFNINISYILYNIEIDGSFDISKFFNKNSMKNLQNDIIKKIKNLLTPRDLLFHISDFEFIILMEEKNENFGIEHIESFSKLILDNVKEPFIADEIEFVITSSIGVNFVKDDKNLLDNLYKNAQTAKVYVQTNGGNDYKIYTSQIQQLVKAQLVEDLKKHIDIRSHKVNNDNQKIIHNEQFEIKVFFLYPQDIIQNQLIKEIVNNEYAAYILKNHEKAKKLLKKHPNSIMFINIDSILTDNEWKEYVKEINIDPDLWEVRIGILSHYNDDKKEECYLMELMVPCGYVKLKSGFEESLKIILSALEANEARGKRKYVRVSVSDHKNVSCNIRINNTLYKCSVNDISSIGISFQFDADNEPFLRENTDLDDIQLLLKGNICHISGKIIAIRELNQQKIYVATFEKNINYKEKEKIHNFIFKSLQEDIEKEMETI